MIIAIDTNAILPGRVGGIENYTLGVIEALKLPGSPASKLILLTRPENHELFSSLCDSSTQAVRIERPRFNGREITNWADLLRNEGDRGRRMLESFQRRKAEFLNEYEADLVHFPGNTINPLDLNLPIVLNLHDLQHRHFPQYFTPQEIENRERWWVASARRADALIAASNYVKEDLRRELGIEGSRIFVTPDIFQSAFFSRPSPEQLRDLRKKLNLPETFFLYPAAVWPHKNHDRLIQAFVSAKIPGAKLVLTGAGQEESHLPKLIAELGVRDKVQLAGRVGTEDLTGLYHLATALVFPSEHESWSIPVMEAMACGCPVASSNVTSLPEEVGDAGLLFAPDDLDAMARAMRELAANKDLRQQLALRGKQRVQQFAPKRFVQTVALAYEHALRTYRTRKAA